MAEKTRKYPFTLDQCIKYFDQVSIECIAGAENNRVGGMALCTAKFLDELKALRPQIKEAGELSPNKAMPKLPSLEEFKKEAQDWLDSTPPIEENPTPMELTEYLHSFVARQLSA